MNEGYGLMTFEEVRAYLADLEDQLDPRYLEQLNGGILLVADRLRSEHDQGDDLFTLGMYHYEPRGLGRYITLYYGSFARIYGYSSREDQKKALRDVLMHELQHHLESLSGDHSLEKEDRDFLRKYYQGKRERRK